MNGLTRLRYKTYTSFGLSALALIAMIRLWGIAPPSAHTAAAYLTVAVLAVAAFWRGVIFARAAGFGAKT